MKVRAWKLAAVVFVPSIAGCGEDAPRVETAAALAAALADAQPGDTVDVGEGTFEGSFELPAGVDLRGSGRGQTRLVGHDGENVLTVLPGDGPTQVSGLTVESGGDGVGGVGIYAVDAGRVTLDRVDVDLDFGIGIGVQGLESLTLHGVTVSGAVTAGNVDEWVNPMTALNTPARGIVVLSTASVTIDEITVSGVAVTGIQLVDSDTHWINGSLHTNMGTSILVSAGNATLEDVSVSGMLQGFGLIPPYGVAVAAGAVLDTTELSIFGEGGDGDESVGMLQDEARSIHRGLSVTDNVGRGVQVQHSPGTLEAPALLLEAGDNDLSRNKGIGLAVLESSGIVVQDAVIEDTVEVTTIVGDLTKVQIGDGIELRRCGDVDCAAQLTDVRFERVSLHGNARAGMVIEALDAPASGVFCGTIDVDLEGIGAVVQNNTDAPGGWSEIANVGSADVLETVRGVEPDFNEGGASIDAIAGR